MSRHKLVNFGTQQQLFIVDRDLLSSDTFTHVSEINGSRRWLDHCVVTSAARQTVISAKVYYDVFWSDHYPLEIVCDMVRAVPRIDKCCNYNDKNLLKGVIWGTREQSQINKYHYLCNSKLKHIDFPVEMTLCCDSLCNNVQHRKVIDYMYKSIINILKESSAASSVHVVEGVAKLLAGTHMSERSIKWLEFTFKNGVYVVSLFLEAHMMKCVPPEGNLSEGSDTVKIIKIRLRWTS